MLFEHPFNWVCYVIGVASRDQITIWRAFYFPNETTRRMAFLPESSCFQMKDENFIINTCSHPRPNCVLIFNNMKRKDRNSLEEERYV